jgi:TonB family protein
MNNQFTIEQFDADITALLAGGEPLPAPREAEATAMLAVAQDLALAPRADFKDELRARLMAAHEKSPATELPLLFQNSELNFQASKPKMAASLGLHAMVMSLIVISGVLGVRNQSSPLMNDHSVLVLPDVAMPISPNEAHGGGGGGDRSKLEASHGEPPKFATSQITPPMVVVKNPNPALPVEPTIVVPLNARVPSNDVGDPLSKGLIVSNGTGVNAGIGSGKNGGVGEGTGSGIGLGIGGGLGGNVYRVGGGVSAPHPISTPDPEYSEEARKANVQGRVTLYAVVGQDGVPRNLKIQRGLGMGLDEKAIQAVSTWRFEPAKKDGRAVPVMVNIEVNFRLY